MDDFVSGPLVWIAFLGFFAGSLYKIVTVARLAKKERVVYPTFNAKYGARSLLHWVIPFASTNMRTRPLYSLLSYLFHICVVVTPLFLMGHAVLWQKSWGVRWWSLPDGAGRPHDPGGGRRRSLLRDPSARSPRGAQRHRPGRRLPARAGGDGALLRPASLPTGSGCPPSRW